MAKAKSLKKAAESAYAGEGDESQESQDVLNKYMLRYGVGTTSSSPHPDNRLEAGGKVPETKTEAGARKCGENPQRPSERQRDAADTAANRVLNAPSSVSASQLAPRTNRTSVSAPSPSHEKVVELSSLLEADDDVAPGPRSQAPAHPDSGAHGPTLSTDILQPLPRSDSRQVPKMDSDSPTQANSGRRYEQYDHVGGDGLSQGASFGERTFGVDDTGVVEFAKPVDFDVSPVSLRSQSDLHSRGPPPETPAAPRNPFAAKDEQAALLGASQLFRHTQFSSAVRRISPTSSRPSPDNFPDNSISPNPVLSSPLKTRGLRSSPPVDQTSSPQFLPDTSSRPHDEASTPLYSTSTRGYVPSESPRPGRRKIGHALEPIGEYESMRQSQERRKTSAVEAGSTVPDDSSEDEVKNRRRRAKPKRDAATRHLSSITFKRPFHGEEVEVPSTGKKGRKQRTAAEGHATQHYGTYPSDDGGSDDQEAVADSQGQVPQPAEEEPRDSFQICREDGNDRHMRTPAHATMTCTGESLRIGKATNENCGPLAPYFNNDADDGDAIPETSPPENRLKPFSEFHAESSARSSKPLSIPTISDTPQGSSYPVSRQSPCPPIALQSRTTSQDRPEPSPNNDGHEPSNAIPGALQECLWSSPAQLQAQKLPSEEPSPPESSSPPSSSGVSRKSSRGAPRHPPSSAPAGSTSVLSSLMTTPNLSNKTTPATDASNGIASHYGGSPSHNSSPAVSKVKRLDVLENLPRLKTAPEAKTSARVTRQHAHQTPSSTDELMRSPASDATFEHSLWVSRTSASRPGRPSIKPQPAARDPSLRSGKPFEGMAFAISFQSKKAGENVDQFNVRMELAKSMEKDIHQAGGRVLSSGFDELFEKPLVKTPASSPTTASRAGSELQLLSSAVSTGFTALIADGHSRKVKYMQALALGFPCIAARWITACLEKEMVVDWSPYLLCAGQSSFLGDAIRSRNLVPYDAVMAKLTDLVKERPRLLDGSNILLVMKKSEEGKRMPYVFLAHVLGASLSRVYSLDEARDRLRAMEDLGRPYDWVLVDEKADRGELFRNTSALEGKKRKRPSAGTNAEAGRPPKKIRTLSDELVIQSLILGRLIEEDEMGE